MQQLTTKELKIISEALAFFGATELDNAREEAEMSRLERKIAETIERREAEEE